MLDVNVPSNQALEADPGKKEAAAETAPAARDNSSIGDLPAVADADFDTHQTTKNAAVIAKTARPEVPCLNSY